MALALASMRAEGHKGGVSLDGMWVGLRIMELLMLTAPLEGDSGRETCWRAVCELVRGLRSSVEIIGGEDE